MWMRKGTCSKSIDRIVKIADSALLNLFINGLKRCHPLAHERNFFTNYKNIRPYNRHTSTNKSYILWPLKLYLPETIVSPCSSIMSFIQSSKRSSVAAVVSPSTVTVTLQPAAVTTNWRQIGLVVDDAFIEVNDLQTTCGYQLMLNCYRMLILDVARSIAQRQGTFFWNYHSYLPIWHADMFKIGKRPNCVLKRVYKCDDDPSLGRPNLYPDGQRQLCQVKRLSKHVHQRSQGSQWKNNVVFYKYK